MGNRKWVRIVRTLIVVCDLCVFLLIVFILTNMGWNILHMKDAFDESSERCFHQTIAACCFAAAAVVVRLGCTCLLDWKKND